MNTDSSLRARFALVFLAGAIAAQGGCGGGDDATGTTPAEAGVDGGDLDGGVLPIGEGGPADTGTDGATATDTGVTDTGVPDTGNDAGPSFTNPKLAWATADGSGSINAALHVPGAWFVGGNFARASSHVVANLVPLDTSAGASRALPTACPIKDGFNGSINAIAQTATAIYVGGAFNTYQGASANRIAKIDPVTCALDATFSPPAANGFNDTVFALTVNATDIFVGGQFTAYKGTPNSANRLAKLNLTTGAIDTTFSPVGGTTGNGFDTSVFAIALTNTDVFVGGSFTQYKGAANSASRLAKLNITTGVLDTAFSPSGVNANGFSPGEVDAIAINANDLYVGGSFTQYKNVAASANRIAKLSLASGAIDTTFSPAGAGLNGFDGQVFALAINGTDVYAGGAFTAYKGVVASANRIAKLGLTTGSLDGTFSPTGAGLNGFDGTVTSLALTATDLYVGGAFGAYKGTPGAANRFAKLAAATGAIDATFLPADSNTNGFAGGGAIVGNTTVVNAIMLAGTTLWVGGRFSLYGGSSVNNIAKMDDVTFSVDTAFSPTAGNGFNGIGGVLALAASGTSVYAGGDFTAYRGVAASANRVAKLDQATGAIDTTFSPAGATTNGFDNTVRALAANATDVYVGGDFTAYKGVANSSLRIAKLNAATGAIDTVFSPPGATTNGFNAAVATLAINASNVFAGGSFITYRNIANSTNRIAKLNLTTGAVDTTFNPVGAGNNGFTDGGQVAAIALNATDVYVGGAFTSYKGLPTTANRIAKLAIATGAIDTAFSPPGLNANGFDNQVSSIALTGADLYAGGNFTAYKGLPASANRIAKLNLFTGSLDNTFSPTTNGFDASVNTVALGASSCGAGCGTVLLAGGSYTAYRGLFARNMAVLDPTSGLVK